MSCDSPVGCVEFTRLRTSCNRPLEPLPRPPPSGDNGLNPHAPSAAQLDTSPTMFPSFLLSGSWESATGVESERVFQNSFKACFVGVRRDSGSGNGHERGPVAEPTKSLGQNAWLHLRWSGPQRPQWRGGSAVWRTGIRVCQAFAEPVRHDARGSGRVGTSELSPDLRELLEGNVARNERRSTKV